MSHKTLVTKQLGDFLGVLSHPHRIRIIEELRDGEKDVNSLRVALGISHSGVSQHLMVRRTNRLVCERREGRHVFYHLRQRGLAAQGYAVSGARNGGIGGTSGSDHQDP